MSLGINIEAIIKSTVEETLAQKKLPDVNYIETDNLGEVVEKLAILHIRTWMLEDAIQEAKTDAEIAEIKKKIDICFKVKRPKFVQAINALVDKAILDSKSLVEDSVKLYRGVDG